MNFYALSAVNTALHMRKVKFTHSECVSSFLSHLMLDLDVPNSRRFPTVCQSLRLYSSDLLMTISKFLVSIDTVQLQVPRLNFKSKVLDNLTEWSDQGI